MQYSAVLYVLLTVLFMSPDKPKLVLNAQLESTLNAKEEQLVRDAVYRDGILGTGTVFVDDVVPWTVHPIPKPLIDLYTKRPRAVLELLLKIMEGANPEDSAVAAGYALSLIIIEREPKWPHGAGGCAPVEFFDRETYDIVQKHWKKTPRQHWIGWVRKEMNQKKEPSK